MLSPSLCKEHLNAAKSNAAFSLRIKKLNILIYGLPFCVSICGSYRRLNMVEFFGPPHADTVNQMQRMSK